MADLGSHIVRSTTLSSCHFVNVIGYLLWNTKVAKFENILLYKNVLCFDISMQNFLTVQGQQWKCYLCNIHQDLIISKSFSLLGVWFNELCKIASLGILHDNVNYLVVDERVLELNDCRPSNYFEEFNFLFGFQFISIRQILKLYLLDGY